MKAIEIKYLEENDLTLSYEGSYDYRWFYGTIGDALEAAVVGMKTHNFQWCDIIDSDTGEVLVRVFPDGELDMNM